MTKGARFALALALLIGGAARFDAVSRLYAPDADQKTDVRRYYQGMAESVLAGRGWIPTYPTNFIPPPGQAVFILIPKWLLPSVDFRQLRVLQAVISTLTILLGFRIASRLWGPAAGLATAWLLALFYPLVYYVGTLVPETNYIACLFGFALACVEAQRRPRVRRFAFAGGLLGLAVCFKPVPSLLAIALVPWVWTSSPIASRRRCAIAFLVAAWVLPGVWIVRNALHYGHIYPVSTNGGTLLALANNEGLDPARANMMYWDDLYRGDALFRDAATPRSSVGSRALLTLTASRKRTSRIARIRGRRSGTSPRIPSISLEITRSSSGTSSFIQGPASCRGERGRGSFARSVSFRTLSLSLAFSDWRD